MAVWQRPKLIARGDPTRPAVVAAIANRLRPLPVGTLVWAADGDLPWSSRVVRLEKYACAKLEGWPSFYDPKDSDAVELIADRSHGMARTEVRCARCGSHLGHVFEGEGNPTPTDQRYCINSISLRLAPDEG
ncbi:peptide-methionine (R)-S-oxide reductase [Streptomyces mirabilis]|uniref:peptide-methionine (R)-S-oxide reductase n=1 Tax=Streptomyces mirabilis TaxID=68239 RepID=UPI0031B9F89C